MALGQYEVTEARTVSLVGGRLGTFGSGKRSVLVALKNTDGLVGVWGQKTDWRRLKSKRGYKEGGGSEKVPVCVLVK